MYVGKKLIEIKDGINYQLTGAMKSNITTSVDFKNLCAFARVKLLRIDEVGCICAFA